MTNSSIILESKSLDSDTLAPSEIRETRSDDIKRYTVGVLLQRREYLCYLEIRSGPAVDEKERDGIGRRRFLMYVVDVEVVETVGFDGTVEVGELVELGFLGSPVKAVVPVFG